MTTEKVGIDYFGRGHWFSSLEQQVSMNARRRMFARWQAFEVAHGIRSARLLDVGGTPDTSFVDSNYIVRCFQEAGSTVSMYSPEDLSHLQQTFPGLTVLPPSPGSRRLPAADRAFDVITASAVLEHVGDREDQCDFIRECARVGNAMFLTTPNRGQWLEFYTKLPLVHWLPRPTHRRLLRAVGKPFWADARNLRLLWRSELVALAREALGEAFVFEVDEVWTLGMPSNLLLLAYRRDAR